MRYFVILMALLLATTTYAQNVEKSVDEWGNRNMGPVSFQIFVASINSELPKVNEYQEINVRAKMGVKLSSASPSNFFIKGIKSGEKLFLTTDRNGRNFWCSQSITSMEFRVCLIDFDNDQKFDAQCVGVNSINGYLPVRFIPEQLRYGILEIRQPCFDIKPDLKPNYSSIEENEFEPVTVKFYTEKMVGKSVRVLWGVPYGKKNLQWGQQVPYTFPDDENYHDFKFGGVTLRVHKPLDGSKYELEIVNINNEIPFLDSSKGYSTLINAE